MNSSDKERKLLEDLGGFKEITLSEKYEKLFDKACDMLFSGDKENFDTTLKIHFLKSPIQQANFKYITFFRITDAILIIQETIKYVEKELEGK